MRKIYFAAHPKISKEDRETHFVNDITKVPDWANVLRQPDDTITLEFDENKGFGRKECENAIQEMIIILRDAGIKFRHTGHMGFSDYLRVEEIIGMEEFDHETRKAYKLAFYDKYVPKQYRPFVDEKFVQEWVWITPVGKEHWKKITQHNKDKGEDYSYYTIETEYNYYNPAAYNKIDDSLLKLAKERCVHSNSSNNSNMNNKSHLSNLSNHIISNTISQHRKELKKKNKDVFGVQEDDTIKKWELRTYTNTDFSKGGLKYKPEHNIPYTTLHRGLNVIRIYKRIKDFEMGGYHYGIYEFRAYYMPLLKYENYGYIALPKRLETDVIRKLYNEFLLQAIEHITLIIHKLGNNRFPSYEFEILNHKNLEEFLESIKIAFSDGDEHTFENLPLLVPRFELNKYIRERKNTYRGRRWVKLEKEILEGNLKHPSQLKQQGLVDLFREMMKLGRTEAHIHELCKLYFGKDYSEKITNVQIKSIKEHIEIKKQ